MRETTQAASFRGFVVLCGLFFVNSVCQKQQNGKIGFVPGNTFSKHWFLCGFLPGNRSEYFAG